MLSVTLLLQIKANNAETAIKTLSHHWIIKFGPPLFLDSDQGSEYVNEETAHLCTLMGVRHSPRTAHSPWTNGLVENRTEILKLIYVCSFKTRLKLGHS